MFLELCTLRFAEKITDDVYESLKDSLKAGKSKIVAASVLRIKLNRYAEHIASVYNEVKVLGMEKPIPLNEVYIKLLLSHGSSNSGYRIDGRSDFTKSREVTVEAALKSTEKAIVLGRPGAGKTTLLKYLAISNFYDAYANKRVPVFVSLNDWSKNENMNLETFIVKQFDCCEFDEPAKVVKHLLRKGVCLILLDGYDETVPTFQSAAIRQIEHLSRTYDKNQFVMSCRSASLNHTFVNFTEMQVADFNEVQIQKFIRSYFRHDTSFGEKLVSELNKRNNVGIKDLASNPLMLTLICIAYQATASFPENKTQLYKTALGALLERWDGKRGIVRKNPYEKLTVRKKETLFANVAAFGTKNNMRTYHFKDIEEIIDSYMRGIQDSYEPEATAVLEAIEAQHGIFIHVDGASYAFSHLTFQEYYTAKFILDSTDATMIERVLSNHIGDSTFNEIFQIFCGLTKSPVDFLNLYKKKLIEVKNSCPKALLRYVMQVPRAEMSARGRTYCILKALSDCLAIMDYMNDDEYLGSASKSFADSCNTITETLPEWADESTNIPRLTHDDTPHLIGFYNSHCTEDWENLARYAIGMYIYIVSVLGDEDISQFDIDKALIHLFEENYEIPDNNVCFSYF